ncbi:MAG: Na+:solute symporter [candidate division KSB1 bacterium]|nr:Na+:solute symporter [candidate division KSB1 bacterium]
MGLTTLDWAIVTAYFVLSLVVGLAVSKRAGRSSAEYFASGRAMPWWLLGVSMVATTFSADTPNLVTDMVRQHGVAGNWLWWAFLLTGMTTVFIYAKLWRRSGVLTDLEFYELRYSGKTAAFLRGFRALYLGIFFNVMIMATVLLAAIKMAGVMLGFSPVWGVSLMSAIVVIYSMLGGLRGVLVTDFVQFFIAMAGSLAAAVVVLGLPQVGGLANLLRHPNVAPRISILPDFSDTSLVLTVFLVPLLVQWWSVWYPGAEPGGGGYIAQRMLAAKDERHAVGATLLFNIAHYALRPWPWILVALGSLVVFPTLGDLQKAFPHIPSGILRHDLAYPAMLTFLPRGVLGLMVASLLAAVMSTISTHLNWGASYIVNDFYKRFARPGASERELVLVGRISTLVLMILAAALALFLSNALQAFHILLQIGAGTGLLFLLRWFWWRISAVSEIAAMVVSFLVAVFLEIVYPRLGLPALAEWQRLVGGVFVTTIGWMAATVLTKPTDVKTLVAFYRKVHPGGPGWGAIHPHLLGNPGEAEPVPLDWDLGNEMLCVFLGLVLVYGFLFGMGFVIYGNTPAAAISLIASALAGLGLARRWPRLRFR